ncbi:phage major capsid protein [Paraburkholderia sp. BR10936]|uniref:phage major capsid protein n=1 Tax=Paraburkholderia sp. BR10936 TaxID=3236993 RepID=UPI0034D3695D
MIRSDDKTQLSKVARALSQITERGLIQRDMTVSAVDVEARTVELAFSSEIEYPRWFGIEILSHDPAHVDMSRLQNKAAVLWNHNWDDMRGVVESASIDSDRVGRAKVRISTSPAGEQLLRDVADQIITKISVGYAVTGLKLVEEREDTDVFLVNAWMPYEISFVSVPADDTVGVGRSAEIARVEPVAAQVENQDHQPTPKEGNRSMNTKVLRDASGNLVRAKVDENGAIIEVLEVLEVAGAAQRDAQAAQARGADTERQRVRDLTQMGRDYGQVDKALQFIAEGKTPDDFRRELLADYATQRAAGRPLSEQAKGPGAEIGMTNKEARQFSILRAVRALANPHNKAYQQDAAFEFECSRAAEEAYGKTSKGVLVPADVLNRAFSSTTPASGPGSNAIATNLLANEFISLLRHRTWALKRVRTMGGLVGNVDLPRQNSATQAYWVGEGAAPSESEPGLDQISFTPKTLAAYTDITRRLMLQSSIDAENFVRDDLIAVMARALDKAVLYGAGTDNTPTGLINQDGINAVALAASDAAYKEYVAMETAIAAADADVGTMSYVINAKARGSAKTTLQFPDVNGSQRIWEPGGTINGYAVDVTNQIDGSDVWFGNWNDFIVAMWSGLDLMVDPYSLSTSGGTRLIAFQDVDMNVRHTQSFSYATKASA